MKLIFKIIPCLLLVGVLIVGHSAFATPVDIQNASFESHSQALIPHTGFGAFSIGAIDGWEYVGTDGIVGVWAPSESQYTTDVPDGNLIGFLGEGTIRQTTNHLVTANNEFTLTLDIGNRLDRNFPDFEIRLLSGENVMASGSLEVSSGTFDTLTLAYTALAGDQYLGGYLGIEIISFGPQLNFDNVRLSNDHLPVPEPAAFLLLGTGLLGLAGFTRKPK